VSSQTPPPEPTAKHDADSCPFGHIDGVCAGEVFDISEEEITERFKKSVEDGATDPWIIGGVYNKMVHRNPDGSDPLVQEPKGKP
jgi:hypothetical protein